MYRISVKAIEPLESLQSDLRTLLEEHQRADWDAMSVSSTRRSRIAETVGSTGKDTANLAVYRLVHESHDGIFERDTVAPRNPMVSIDADVAVEGGRIIFRDVDDGTSIELHLAEAIVPVDWEEYWSAGS